MRIEVQLFGAFREFGDQLTLELAPGAVVADIRKSLVDKLREQGGTSLPAYGLITSSHFATESELLSDNHPLEDGASIAIIPPVAGG